MPVALVIQQAKCMLRMIAFCSLSGSTNFFTLSRKWHDFRGEKVIELKICFDFLYNFCLKNFSFYEELREMLS